MAGRLICPARLPAQKRGRQYWLRVVLARVFWGIQRAIFYSFIRIAMPSNIGRDEIMPFDSIETLCLPANLFIIKIRMYNRCDWIKIFSPNRGSSKKYVSLGVCCIQLEELPFPLYNLFTQISLSTGQYWSIAP